MTVHSIHPMYGLGGSNRFLSGVMQSRIMSALIKCPKCYRENPSSARYCANCGNDLATTVKPSPNAPLRIPEYPGSFPFSTQPLDHALAHLDVEKRKSVRKTRTWALPHIRRTIVRTDPCSCVVRGLIAYWRGSSDFFLVGEP